MSYVLGNIPKQSVLSLTLSPVAVGANTTAEQTFTVNGLVPGDMAVITKPTTQAGLGVVNSRVSAANTLAVTFSNNTGGSITPTANEVYLVLVSRPDRVIPDGNI